MELDGLKERARMGARGRASKGKIAGIAKYGYRIGADSKPEIVNEEAENVRRIFRDYTAGGGCRTAIFTWQVTPRG